MINLHLSINKMEKRLKASIINFNIKWIKILICLSKRANIGLRKRHSFNKTKAANKVILILNLKIRKRVKLMWINWNLLIDIIKELDHRKYCLNYSIQAYKIILANMSKLTNHNLQGIEEITFKEWQMGLNLLWKKE
jgi:hypothetical protein